VLALLGLAAVWVVLPRAGLAEANYERIREGMAEADVEQVLGGPYGQHFTGNVCFCRAGLFTSYLFEGEHVSPDDVRDGTRKWWVGDELAIWVDFSRDGVVIGKNRRRVTHLGETFLDRLRHLLRW
jgi:hypothetical protein